MHKNARTSLTKKVSRSASYRLRSDFVLTSFFKTIRYCKSIALRKRNVMLFLTATVSVAKIKRRSHLLYDIIHLSLQMEGDFGNSIEELHVAVKASDFYCRGRGIIT